MYFTVADEIGSPQQGNKLCILLFIKLVMLYENLSILF